MIEPNSFEEAKKDKFWNKVRDEEFNQIEKNDTWELVPRPKNKNVIGTKWVFRNKLNEDGFVPCNLSIFIQFIYEYPLCFNHILILWSWSKFLSVILLYLT